MKLYKLKWRVGNMEYENVVHAHNQKQADADAKRFLEKTLKDYSYTAEEIKMSKTRTDVTSKDLRERAKDYE